MKSPERKFWLEAIKEEFNTLEKNGTWELCDNLPRDKNILPSGIVLKLKRNSAGDPARFKGLVVARGSFQDDISIYLELCAPVACIEVVRLIITVAFACGWEINLVDVNGAFFHALLPIGEEINIRLPTDPGLENLSGKVVRLIKSFYGLRQAQKLWYGHFFDSVSMLGFKRAHSSDCLFVWTTPYGKVFFAVLRQRPPHCWIAKRR